MENVERSTRYSLVLYALLFAVLLLPSVSFAVQGQGASLTIGTVAGLIFLSAAVAVFYGVSW